MKRIASLLICAFWILGCQDNSKSNLEIVVPPFEMTKLKVFKKFVPEEYLKVNKAIFRDDEGKEITFGIGTSLGVEESKGAIDKYSHKTSLSNNNGARISFSVEYSNIGHEETLMVFIIDANSDILNWSSQNTDGRVDSIANKRGSITSLMLNYINDQINFDSTTTSSKENVSFCGIGSNYSSLTKDRFENKVCIEEGKGISYFEFAGVGYTLLRYERYEDM